MMNQLKSKLSCLAYDHDYDVLLLQGLPGSGKSSFAKQINQKYPYAVVVSADDEHINAEGKYEFKVENLKSAHDMCFLKYLEAFQDCASLILVDNTNTSYEELLPYVRVAQAYGYNFKVVYFPCSVVDSYKRNVHGVPVESIKRMDQRLKQFHQDPPKDWTIVS